ncbi:MAG: trigger factor [Candidatus Omnitrophota bacterium]
MKVDVKKVSSISRELKFEVPKEMVAPKFDEVYKDLAKVVKVKGFRPGKIPRNVLETHHRKEAEQEVIRKVVTEAYEEAIKKENLAPIDMPEIHDVSLKDGVVKFTAKLEIKPDIKIKDYKALKVKRKSSQVTDEELNKTIDVFKQGQGKDKDVSIDDAFAKGLGFPSLDEFKKSLSRQLEIEKDRQSKLDVENQIIEQLLKSTKVDTPQSLVERQMHRRLHEYEHQLQSQGIKKDDIKKKIDEAQKDLREAVVRDIQVYLILDKIAELEGMEIKQGENLPGRVIEFLLKEAKWES